MDCGEDNPVVLDFDHVRGKKIMSIAIMIQKRATLKKIQDEIDKCEIVCSNCHRIRTSKRGGHWRTARFDNELAALV